MNDLERTIQQIRDLVTTNILAGPKPSPDEMLTLSDEYKQVWETP